MTHSMRAGLGRWALDRSRSVEPGGLLRLDCEVVGDPTCPQR
jgi:hypothetical protein